MRFYADPCGVGSDSAGVGVETLVAPMPHSNDPLPRVLSQLRWRWIVARISDALFVALLAATVTAVAAVCVGVSPAWPGLLGAVAVIAFRWQRLPTRADAAAWLDERHGLADLMGSAWAVRDRLNEPWAAGLWSVANATVVTLPATGRLARFAGRHHACAWAGAAALWLGSGLVGASQPSARSVGLTTPAVAAADPQQVANVLQRQGDTAQSDARLPGLAETTGAADTRRAQSGEDASGPGRAPGGRRTQLPATDSIGSPLPQRAGAGGSGAAATGDGPGNAGGRVRVDPSAQTDPILPPPTASSSAITPEHAAEPVPPEYRDLVRAFFAR